LSTFLAAVQGSILAQYARLIYRTSPLSTEGWEHVEAAIAAQRPIMFASWHGQPHLFYSIYVSFFKPEDLFLVMVGDARRGTLGYFAKYVRATVFPVDMQDGSMAGARRVLDLIGKLVPGTYSYIAPDGPDGPARIAKAGVAFIARKAQALIVPVANATRHALHLPRWDRYWLPLPFDRIHTVFRPAIDAARTTPRSKLLETLTVELNRANARVTAMANHSS
jgi:lysophospholipid acyltransferase (LPLAT)-like uncharacterized protein